MLRFTKMDGAGNDFILLDNRAGHIHLNRSQIARLCDRHRGIGADGVLLLENPSDYADFRMRYFNADGGEAEMCGNGARCFARFANKVAGARGKISFETVAGVISSELAGDLVTLQMTEPTDLRLNVPLHVGAEIRQAEAAFAVDLRTFLMNDLGIDQHDPSVWIFLERDIDDCNAA